MLKQWRKCNCPDVDKETLCCFCNQKSCCFCGKDYEDESNHLIECEDDGSEENID